MVSFGTVRFSAETTPAGGVQAVTKVQAATGSAASVTVPNTPHAADVVVISKSGLQQEIQAGKHSWTADEPVNLGGNDAGPNPYDLLLGALGACTAMTLQMYARHKKWPLESVRVELSHDKIHAADCQDCDTKEGKVDRITRHITVSGPLTPEQVNRLGDIAEKCPVHKTLTGEIKVEDNISHDAAG